MKYIWFFFYAQVLLISADESLVVRKRERATAFGEIEEVFANSLNSKEDLFRDRMLPMSMDYFVIDKPIHYGKKGAYGGKKGGHYYGKKGGYSYESGSGYESGPGSGYYGKKGGYAYGKKGGHSYGKKGYIKYYVVSSPSAPGSPKYEKDEPYVFGHSRDRD